MPFGQTIKDHGRSNNNEIIDILDKSVAQAKKDGAEEERVRIFNAFIVAGSAMTMFNQNDAGLMFAAEGLREKMIEICHIKLSPESGEKREFISGHVMLSDRKKVQSENEKSWNETMQSIGH